MRLCDDRVIARNPGELRVASRVLFEQGRTRGLLAFSVVDTHVHALVACARVVAGKFARYSEAALRKRLGLVPFDGARIRPILDQSHLRSAFLYVLRQHRRHGSSLDPAHDGSSLLDLLGLRVLDQTLAGRVRSHLPRLRAMDVAPDLVAALRSLPVSLDLLAHAAAAAIGAASLQGQSPDVVAARRAAVHVAATLDATRIGELLSLDVRVVRRHRREEPDEPLVRAVRRQLRLQLYAATTVEPHVI
jgi:hypothetical protein